MIIQRTDVYQNGILQRAPLNPEKGDPAWKVVWQQLDKARLSRIERLINKDFTIISSNCSASLIYESLHLQKRTPTCSLTVSPDAFIVQRKPPAVPVVMITVHL